VPATRTGSAWHALFAGLASVFSLPLAVYLTRFSASYDLLHASFAIPVGGGLGLVAINLARRRRRRTLLRVDGGRDPVARFAWLLGVAGLCLALAGLVALAVYGLLEYAGTRG